MKQKHFKTTGGVCAAFAMVAAAMACAAAHGANDWENTRVNSSNRMAAATYAMPLADEAAALTRALEPVTPYKMTLNGVWRFKWVGDPARRPAGFHEVGFDDSKWTDIDVPSCVEMRGHGSPIYTNRNYPHKNDWPRIRDRFTGRADYNPVSSYRRSFMVPAHWQGRETILRFDGAGSALYVWVNGRPVGYAEDSKLPSEFNVTDFLVAGTNTIAVQVFKWCDGSYLEDQDMFRFSGLFRDVSLWSRPKAGIADFRVTQTFGKNYKNAEVAVAVETYGGAKDVTATLYDADFKEVGRATAGIPPVTQPHNSPIPQFHNSTISLSSPHLWSAESPYLYTLVLRCGDDIRMKRVGLKEQRVVGNKILVNGKPVKFKGVNRHETNPDNGRTVSLDDMVADITLMKRYNVNTVRTCHYPDHHLWYDLCDRYGIYLVAEANVEGHEPGYGDKGLGRFKEWDSTIVERNLRHVKFYRNHPSVTLWSMGNETGHGDCFRHAIAAVKTLDPSRPVHWERGNVDADVDSTMYPTVEWLDKRGRLGDGLIPDERMTRKSMSTNDRKPDPTDNSRNKAFFLCEYAHAMGNAIGNFQEYWDVFYKYDSLSGGCIWDWVDQGIWKYTDRIDPKTGKRERYLAYGGDFDDQPNDGPFCLNGVVDPLRNVSPKLLEVAHVHRNLVVERGTGNGEQGTVFKLWNRFAFTYADEFDGRWQLVEDGVEVASGRIAPAHIAPLSRGDVTLEGLDEALAKSDAKKERFVNVSFATKAKTLWADAGWVVARDQIALPPAAGAAVADKKPAADEGRAMGVMRRGDILRVERGGTSATFSRRAGTAIRLVLRGGARVFDTPAPGIVAGPRLTCARAFVDNDKWMKEDFMRSGLTQLKYTAEPFVVEGNSVKCVVDVSGAKGCGWIHVSVWSFGADGSVTISNKATPYGTMPKAIPRLGLEMLLSPLLENMRWYGRGPEENYVDRCTASFVGIWKSTVTGQYVDYIRPQDCCCKCGVRWAEFTSDYGVGVRFSSDVPMFMTATHYTWEDLYFSRFERGAIRHRTPLVPNDDVVLRLDARQTGLGGASCGPGPLDAYRFDPSAEVSWTVKMEPVKASGGEGR